MTTVLSAIDTDDRPTNDDALFDSLFPNPKYTLKRVIQGMTYAELSAFVAKYQITAAELTPRNPAMRKKVTFIKPLAKTTSAPTGEPDVDTVVALLESHPKGLKNGDIQRELGANYETVTPLLVQAMRDGKVERKGKRRSTVYLAK